jgi:hypothetical protein
MTAINIVEIANTVATANPTCRNPLAIAQRYVDTVKRHIVNGMTRSNSDQLLLGWFPIGLKNLQNECGKFKPGNQYYFKILHQTHPLFTVIETGSNLKGKQTVAETDIPLEILLAEGDAKTIMKAIYKDIDPTNPPEIDFVSINIQNLTNYINRQKTYSVNDTNARNLRDAGLIKIVAIENEGQLPMVVNESAYGRKYYRGLNLQSCSREVRHAALGPVWSVDISNAVFNWRYSNFHQDGRHLLINTRCYLQEKDRIRKKLAFAVFGNAEKYSIETVKRVMTAISFGARGETNSWYRNELGHWIQGSISTIIKSPERRQAFFAFKDLEFSMPEFMHEQELINEYLLKHKFANLLKDPEIKKLCLTESGKRVSEKKFLALMYQQEERHIMEQVNRWANSPRLLLVHDGAYYANKPDIASMNTELQRIWPMASFDLHKIEPWLAVYSEEEKIQIQSHQQHIQEEERAANLGVDPVRTGIHTERLAIKKYDPHTEPDWVALQWQEYNEHFAPKYPEHIQNILDGSRKHAG